MGNTSSEIIYDNSDNENDFECIDHIDHTDHTIEELKEIQLEYKNLFSIYKNIIKENKDKID